MSSRAGLGTTAQPSTSKLTTTSTSPLTSTTINAASNEEDLISEFVGDVTTDDVLPTQADLIRVQDTIVLDEEGKSRSFREVFTGPNIAPRVLIIFVRHFFCGNCQEYINTLSTSISTDSLLALPIPTSVVIIGCGAPSLIPDYRSRTQCTFPIYSDPTNKLYTSLGMSKTLTMGPRPEYVRANAVSLTIRSLFQNLRQIPVGGALAGGNMRQVGGEFLFEPVNGSVVNSGSPNFGDLSASRDNCLDVEKRIIWCHRMRNTRDHAEIPELREVLGFEDEGVGGGNTKRWSKALASRKGTSLSSAGRQSVSKEVTVP